MADKTRADAEPRTATVTIAGRRYLVVDEKLVTAYGKRTVAGKDEYFEFQYTACYVESVEAR